MNVTRLKLFAGIILIALGTAWSLAAAWLSANLFISVRTEVLGYKNYFFAAVVGSFLFITAGKVAGQMRIVRYAISFSALVIIAVVWISSDKIFAYWKMRAVPAATWQQAAAEIEKLAEEAPTTDKVQPWTRHARELPKSAGIIGLPEDYAAGVGGYGLYGSDGTIACLTYGFKPRTWGLFVGPDAVVLSGWRKYRIIRVATNGYFFVGPNY
jgi:hypothetical protein